MLAVLAGLIAAHHLGVPPLDAGELVGEGSPWITHWPAAHRAIDRDRPSARDATE